MTSMTRWNPFKTLSHIDPFSDFEDFLRDATMRSLWGDAVIAPEIRMEVVEDGADGVKTDNNQAALSAEAKQKEES